MRHAKPLSSASGERGWGEGVSIQQTGPVSPLEILTPSPPKRPKRGRGEPAVIPSPSPPQPAREEQSHHSHGGLHDEGHLERRRPGRVRPDPRRRGEPLFPTRLNP